MRLLFLVIVWETPINMLVQNNTNVSVWTLFFLNPFNPLISPPAVWNHDGDQLIALSYFGDTGTVVSWLFFSWIWKFGFIDYLNTSNVIKWFQVISNPPHHLSNSNLFFLVFPKLSSSTRLTWMTGIVCTSWETMDINQNRNFMIQCFLNKVIFNYLPCILVNTFILVKICARCISTTVHFPITYR